MFVELTKKYILLLVIFNLFFVTILFISPRNSAVFGCDTGDLPIWSMWKYPLINGIKKRRAESVCLHLFDR